MSDVEFTHLGTVVNGEQLYGCMSCGVTVIGGLQWRELHIDWHNRGTSQVTDK